MSAKKKGRADWIFCESCEIWIPLGCPSRCCEEGTNHADSTPKKDNGKRSEWGRITGNRLMAKVRACRETEKLRNGFQSVAFFHPSTLAVMELHAGDYVKLSIGMQYTICTCWPGRDGGVDEVAISKSKIRSLDVDQGEFIEVFRAGLCFKLAGTVVMAIDKCNNLSLNAFEENLCCFLDGCILVVGDVIETHYLGQPLTVTVVDIESDFGKRGDLISKDCSDEFQSSSIEHNTRRVRNDFNTSMDNVLNNLSTLDIKEPSFTSSINDIHAYKVSYPNTKIVVDSKWFKPKAQNVQPESKLMLGGYSEEIRSLKECIQLPFILPKALKNPISFLSMGVIIHGPPGTGKTAIAQQVIRESQLECFPILGPEMSSKYYGETESKLRELFQGALAHAPCIVFIDELDALCPRRDELNNETEKRIVSTLLTLMDGVSQRASIAPVVVLATTNRLDAVEPALRRPGRFDKEIEIGVPNSAYRADILRVLLEQVPHSITTNEMDSIAQNAHGFVGADLMAVVRESFHFTLNRALNGRDITLIQNNEMASLSQRAVVSLQDVKDGLQHVRPSALRSVVVEVPRVHWNDIGGQGKIKQLLKEAIEWPLKHSDAFKRLGVSSPSGVLLYGPPGCSKTLLAKALATESGLNFLSVKGPELFNKFLGESEKAVRTLFQKARSSAPSIIFFDEIDALGTSRGGGSGSNVGERVLAQMLTEMDGIEGLEGVIVVAATNRPDLIDSALLRPGRIDRIIYVPLPDKETRAEIFKIQFRTMPVAKDVDLNILAEMSENYSGAEICAVCKEAAIVALREDIDSLVVKQSHFDDVMYLFKPRTKPEQIQFFENLNLGME